MALCPVQLQHFAYLKSLFAKTEIFKNHVFSLCIPINLNQTAVVLF